MAKDLPYFKFNCAEWISGSITLEDFYIQGVFINICALYWHKSGCIKLSEIKRRLKCKEVVFEKLIESGLIKTDDLDQDFIKISFLDDQIEQRIGVSVRNSENGQRGGAPKGNQNARKNNPESTEEQAKTTNIEEKREEEKRREKKIVVSNVPFVGAVLDSWNEWENFKKEKKQKLTPSTIKKQIQFLVNGSFKGRGGGRSDSEIIAIINQSIEKGWTGLFELNNQNNGINKKSGRGADADVAKPDSWGTL